MLRCRGVRQGVQVRDHFSRGAPVNPSLCVQKEKAGDSIQGPPGLQAIHEPHDRNLTFSRQDGVKPVTQSFFGADGGVCSPGDEKRKPGSQFGGEAVSVPHPARE